MLPITYTVGPLAGASANNICVSQVAPGASALVLDGTLTTGYSVNNIATAQAVGSATNLTLNGSTVSGGIAQLGGRSVVIVSAGDDSGITFTVKGTIAGSAAVTYGQETVTGANASRVATRTEFLTVTSVASSGAAAGNVSVGTNGTVATLDKARRVLFTSGASDAGITFTVYGTDWSGNEISETITGPATTGYTTRDFKTVTAIWPSGATASTLTVGTNGVASSPPILLDTWANAPTALQVDVSGTVNFTVQQTLNDPNRVGYSNVNWVNHPDSALAAATATAQGNYAYAPNMTRITLNSGSGSITYTVLQASGLQ